jgi:hypothetical protein
MLCVTGARKSSGKNPGMRKILAVMRKRAWTFLNRIAIPVNWRKSLTVHAAPLSSKSAGAAGRIKHANSKFTRNHGKI